MSQELLIRDTGVIARAELDTQISTAKAYPRDVKRSIEYATQLATMDEETAASCFYALPRKEKDGSKKEIKGGSIRLAEIMATAWGNIHAATRIIENDGRHVTSEGVAWDLESNVKITMQNKVSIRFGEKDGKGGYTANADMQTVLSNAASAKALRNAIFKVVPKALVDRVLEKAMNFSVGDKNNKKEKTVKLVQSLEEMGLSKEKIFDYYGRASLDDLTDDNLRSLIGLKTAINEGHIKINDVFNNQLVKNNDNAKEVVSDILKNKNSTSMHEKVLRKIQEAKSEDTLHLAADLIRECEEDKREELTNLYKLKLAEVIK